MTDLFERAFEAQFVLFGSAMLWRELIGNLFGMASALGGLRRQVWAWPIGIIGNVLLFTVFMGVWFSTPQDQTLLGQAARQVFFVITSVYGWWRWRSLGRGRERGAPAITPRWATARERTVYLATALVLVVVVQWVFAAVGSAWAAPRWYYWADAWIFVGSMLATFAMARGWNDFWLVWVAVDVVGIPLLLHGGFPLSAALYGLYLVLVLYGFTVWVRATRRERVPAPTGQLPSPAPESADSSG